MKLARSCLLLSALLSLSPEARAVAPGPEEATLLDGLVLEVRERGPNRPWVVAVRNETEARVNVVKDPRLLSLEVKVPGKRKPTSCRLPAAMLPQRAEAERLRELDPGEELRFRIDPRFYCFEGDQGVLVPGAMIEASYGFPQQMRTSRTPGGRKIVERLPSVAPYAAQFLPERVVLEEEGDAEADDPSDEEPSHSTSTSGDGEDASEADAAPAEEPLPPFEPTEHDPDRPGLSSLRSVRLALGSEYSSWDPAARDESLDRGLKLEVIKGSDSLNARGAQVTVRLSNTGHRAERVYVRRHLVSYYLLGPEGLSVCATEGEEHAPDQQSFTTLGPGKRIEFTTRLVEFCPGDIIDRPGFYLVGAELRAHADANEPVDAFEGTLYTTRGKIVRIQKGEQPFVHRNVPRHVLLFGRGGRLLRDARGEPPGPPTQSDDLEAAEGPAEDEADVFDGPPSSPEND